jgi:hypothetical protein
MTLRATTIKELGNVRFVGSFEQVLSQIAATIAMAEGQNK